MLSIVGGLVGDRLQRRTPRGRALVAAVGVLAAVPFYVVLFFVPMRIDVPDGAGSGAVIAGRAAQRVHRADGRRCCLATAVFALALTSANSPNWFALIADVNPPEHRGTVYSLGNLVNGVGRAAATPWSGSPSAGWPAAFPPPLNYAVGLAAFQLFFIPTGVMYWLASRTVAKDMADTHAALLAARASALAEEGSAGGPDGDVGGDPPVVVQGLAAQQDPGAER